MSRRSGDRILDVDLNEPLTGYDYAIEWVLGAALVFSPLAYGATNAWAMQILYGLIAVMALLAGLKLSLVRGTRVVLTWAYLPIFLYLLMVTLSVIPLPAGFVKAISPGTVEEKAKLLSDLPSVGQLLARLTITFNVWSTLMGLRLVLAMSVVFVVIVNICQTPAQIIRVLMLVAGAGLIVTLLALAQDLTPYNLPPQRIYWFIPYISVNAVHKNAGPFAGHAQLGQYLNLTIGAMFALALVQIGQAFRGEDPTSREVMEKFNSTPMRLAVLLFIVMGAAVTAIAWSVSRGALLGLAVAGLISLLLVIFKRGWRKSETVILLNIALLLAILVGAGYFAFEKGFLQRRGTAQEGAMDRLAMVKSMVPMIKQWPVMGTGLESFEWVYPMFQPRSGNVNSFFTHAENDYVQTLSDTGIVGGILTLAFLVILARNWGKAFRDRQPIQLATIGIAFSLIAVMVHSTADFAQRTPAIALVSSVLIGLTFSLSRLATLSEVDEPARPSFGWMPLPRIVVAGVVMVAMGWSVWSLNPIRIAEILEWDSDPTVFFLDARPSDSDFDQKLHAYYRDPIADNTKAVQLDPMNVEYIHELNHFRFRELSGKRDEKTTAIIYPENAEEVGRQIERELSAARVLCPCFGRLHTLLGKIEWDLTDKSSAARNLEIAKNLRPADGEPLFYLCQMAADQGRWDDAASRAKESFARDRGFSQLIINLLARQYSHPELAFEVFRDDPASLDRLIAVLKREDDSELFDKVQTRLLELDRKMTDESPQDVDVWRTLSRHLRDAGKEDEAVKATSRAVDLDYGDVNVRMGFARYLETIGRKDEARKQAEKCLWISPQLDEAKNMIERLRGLPPAPPTSK